MQEGTSDIAALAARVAELEAGLAHLDDRQQISDLYRRYTRAFDRSDVELLRTTFWPDVEINYGSQSNSFDDFVVRHLNLHTDELASYAHHITSESVELDGDVAHVESYVVAFFRPKGDGSDWTGGGTIAGGRYIDRVDRRDGEWRVAVREFIPHFWARTESSFEPTFEDWWPRHEGAMGTWDRRDPSYRRPLERRADRAFGPVCAE